MKVIINIYPKKEILDPETDAVKNSLKNLGFNGLKNFTFGKKISYIVDNSDKNSVLISAKAMCENFLVNQNIQDYDIVFEEDN